jgi:hypothetical protein
LADTSTQGQLGAAPAEDEKPGEVIGRAPGDSQPEVTESSRRGRFAAGIVTAPARLKRTIRVHWQFSLILLAAVGMRVVVIVAYPPIMWFNDSFNYFSDAVTHVPDYVRSNGYPFFLSVLLPLHSMYPIAIAQAAMGAGMGVLIYALLRRRGLPWWGAALPAVPVLFDVFELELEHMVTADTLFTFLVTLALIICCWKDRPTITTMAIVGLLIGYATIVRTVGQPLLVVFIAGMLIRRAGWRQVTALTVAGIVPIAAYMIWFHDTSGKYALNESLGTFLYSRVQTFADCAKMSLPADLKPLCDSTPTYARPPSQEYLWADYENYPYQHRATPLNALYGQGDPARFTPAVESLTQKFAERAILAQPVDYLRVVLNDTLHTFGWNRQPDPHDQIGNGNGPEFRFSDTPTPVPWWALPTQTDLAANALNQQLHQYLGPTIGQPKVVHPWAGFIQGYQRVIWLRGPFLAIILLLGAAGVVVRWRRRPGQHWGGLTLLPWAVGVALIVVPPMTAGFSYRYVLAAVPAACLAAGLAFVTGPGERSVGDRAAELRRNLGRGVPVNQE